MELNKRAFTILELIIAILIISLVEFFIITQYKKEKEKCIQQESITNVQKEICNKINSQ